MEAVIALKPDLVIFSLYGCVPDNVGKLDSAKIPYVKNPLCFVDFFQKPLEKTVARIEMLGKLIEHVQKPKKFNDYYQKHMANVTNQVKELQHYSFFPCQS